MLPSSTATGASGEPSRCGMRNHFGAPPRAPWRPQTFRTTESSNRIRQPPTEIRRKRMQKKLTWLKLSDLPGAGLATSHCKNDGSGRGPRVRWLIKSAETLAVDPASECSYAEAAAWRSGELLSRALRPGRPISASRKICGGPQFLRTGAEPRPAGISASPSRTARERTEGLNSRWRHCNHCHRSCCICDSQ